MGAAYHLGEEGKVYYTATPVTSTTYTLPSTVADNVKDVKVNGVHDTPEYTTRANGGTKQFAVSLTDLSVSFQIKIPKQGTTDAAYNAFRDAWKNKAEIAVFALTYDKSLPGAEGPAGNFVVSKFEIDQSNGTPQFASIELKPSTFNTWHVVSE